MFGIKPLKFLGRFFNILKRSISKNVTIIKTYDEKRIKILPKNPIQSKINPNKRPPRRPDKS